MSNETIEKRPNARALIPILVFLVLYLGNGIYFEYIRPIENQMGFYVMSVVLAFGLALIVAFLQNHHLGIYRKIQICAKGIGDENITIMLFIFLMSGAFSGIAKGAGGVTSTANLLLNLLPGQLAIPGLFLVSCIVSLAMGTSVGTITVLVPIATAIATGSDSNLPLCVATVVGGAMFGDNLSFISDTTIASTKTQGVEMKDKFRANFKIALPAAVITILILTILAIMAPGKAMEPYPYSIWSALPYFLVLILALTGLNVFLVLGIGILLFLVVGMATGALTYPKAFSMMGAGIEGMFETMIVTILAASISALIKENGGFAALLQFIRKHFRGQKGGMCGISLLTLIMDIATANNTVAIVVAAPIAKQISEEYHIPPQKTASLLDTCSCIGQGIIPYGAQLLIAASLSGISSLTIVPYLFYPFLLLFFVILSMKFSD